MFNCQFLHLKTSHIDHWTPYWIVKINESVVVLKYRPKQMFIKPFKPISSSVIKLIMCYDHVRYFVILDYTIHVLYIPARIYLYTYKTNIINNLLIHFVLVTYSIILFINLCLFVKQLRYVHVWCC